MRSSRIADSRTRESRTVVVVDLGRAVRAQHEVTAPPGQLERQAEAAAAAAVDRERLIAHFPAVAVRTMKHAACRRDSRKPGMSGRLSTTPGRDQQLSRVSDAAIGERDFETRVGGTRASITSMSRSSTPSYCRSCSREMRRNSRGSMPSRLTESVHGVRRGIARTARVAHEHAPPAAAEHQRGAQPAGPAPTMIDVVHDIMVP